MSHRMQLTVALSDKYSAQLKAFQEALNSITIPASLSLISESFEAIHNLAGKAQNTITQGFTSSLQGLSLTSISVGQALTTIADTALSLGDMVSALKKVSDETGISINQLNLLSQSAHRFGIASSTIAPSIKYLSENISQFKAGSGALNELAHFDGGQNLLSQLSTIPSIDSATTLSLDMIANAKDPALKKQLAQILFGTSRMAEFGMQGKTAMDSNLHETRTNIRQINQDDIRHAQNLTQSVISVNESFNALKNSLGSALMPSIAMLAETLKNFINQNRDFLEGKFKEMAEALTNWVLEIDWDDIANKIKRFGDVIGGISNFFSFFIPGKSRLQKAVDEIPTDIREQIEKQYPGGSWSFVGGRGAPNYHYVGENKFFRSSITVKEFQERMKKEEAKNSATLLNFNAEGAKYPSNIDQIAEQLYQNNQRRIAEIKNKEEASSSGTLLNFSAKGARYPSNIDQITEQLYQTNQRLMAEIKNKEQASNSSTRLNFSAEGARYPRNVDQIAEQLYQTNQRHIAEIKNSAPPKAASSVHIQSHAAHFNQPSTSAHGSLEISLINFPKGVGTKSDMNALFHDVKITKAKLMVAASMEL